MSYYTLLCTQYVLESSRSEKCIFYKNQYILIINQKQYANATDFHLFFFFVILYSHHRALQ